MFSIYVVDVNNSLFMKDMDGIDKLKNKQKKSLIIEININNI